MVHPQREFTSGEHKGEASSEWRYYLSSRNDIGAAEFNQQIRQHWTIENGCHWVLDVKLREDDCRIHVGRGAENFAILRRMTLNLINKNTTIKASKTFKRNLVAWSTSRLHELLGLQNLVAQEAAATAAA